jgi:hypothetical protein
MRGAVARSGFPASAPRRSGIAGQRCLRACIGSRPRSRLPKIQHDSSSTDAMRTLILRDEMGEFLDPLLFAAVRSIML